jgi:hypothetical protein
MMGDSQFEVGRDRTHPHTERDTCEYKYLVTGSTLAGERLTAVAKIADSGSLVVITVFLV